MTLASKLYFHQHVSYMSSEALELLGPIRFITNNVPALDNLKVL
jgi:hypothetical protein